MSIIILEEKLSLKEKELIEICKSGSGISGQKLRDAHIALGELTALAMLEKDLNINNNFALLILMRAGLCIGEGIAKILEKKGAKVEVHFINEDKLTAATLNSLTDKQVIIADAVINSGKSILNILKQLPPQEKINYLISTSVIPSSAISKLEHLNLYTVRISKHQYEGAKVREIRGLLGPDTGDRLFGTL